MTCQTCKDTGKVWDPEFYSGGIAGCGEGGFAPCPACGGKKPAKVTYSPTEKELDDALDTIRDIRAWIEEVRPILEYVSRGRGYVGVERYPDVEARIALGKLLDREGT